MFISRLACHGFLKQLIHQKNARMISTVLGKFGRLYVKDKVILHHHRGHEFDIFKAESENESFVIKRMPKAFYDVSLQIAADCAGFHWLRLHSDCNDEDDTLIYSFYRSDLLSAIEKHPEMPMAARKKILRRVCEGIQELHNKDWLHIGELSWSIQLYEYPTDGSERRDVKPDNILLNWTCDNGEDSMEVSDVVLGDFDIAFKCDNVVSLNTHHAIGNAMWRSPEGQTGRGITKASDVFSFGLVVSNPPQTSQLHAKRTKCIYVLGGGDFLVIKEEYQELEKRSISVEQEIVTRHFCYFGPASEGLLKQVDSEEWSRLLLSASAVAERATKVQPELKFERWGAELGSDALNLISAMTNTDPTARLTIEQVLSHQWWEKDM